eukprot:385522_1
MSAQVLTMAEGSFGEDNNEDNNSESLKSWMIKNGKKLSDKTYEILNDENIITLEDFKQFTVDELDGMCSEFKISYGDKIKLKRALEPFSSKQQYIDTEEGVAIDEIKNEMNKLKNMLNNLKITQSQINEKKK